MVLSSKENPELKQIARLLSSRRARREEGLFVAEGLRICMEAAASPVTVEAVYQSESFVEKHPKEAALLARRGGKMPPHLRRNGRPPGGYADPPGGVLCLPGT